MKEASAKTMTIAPGLPVSGTTVWTVFPAQSFQLCINPGNCCAKATFSILAFHLSSGGMEIDKAVLYLLEWEKTFWNWMVRHE